MKTLITKILLLLICSTTFAQSGTISGKVLNPKQQPLPGASVLLLHLPDSVQTAGQIADANGAYLF